ncbi:MAG: ABC transporter permease [Clostridia bacterium]|nr:ABC transporter permease [Clostridia bacterium]
MISNQEVKTSVELTEGNRLYAECHNISENHEYAFYVKKDGKKVDTFWYSNKPNCVYWLTEPGVYTVTTFVRNPQGEVAVADSAPVNFEGVSIIVGNAGKRKFDPLAWAKNIKSVAEEIWKNRTRMVRIAAYDHKMAGKDSYLGIVWNVLSPLIQIGAYWFVFGMGIRGGRPVASPYDKSVTIPFLAWMLCGLIPWLFINAGIVRGAASVYSKAAIALRLRYPISTIPAGSVLIDLFDHFIMLGILVITLLVHKIWPNIYWLNIVYYILAAYLMLTALAMLTSTLTMIARDFQLLINSLMRLLFFMTPVVWTPDLMGPKAQFILKLNPFLYIIDGFRDSLLYNKNFWERPVWMAYFWIFFVILLAIGCGAQKRYKDHFLDLL